jgi:hypothetical protein
MTNGIDQIKNEANIQISSTKPSTGLTKVDRRGRIKVTANDITNILKKCPPGLSIKFFQITSLWRDKFS